MSKKTLTLAAVGDICLGDSLESASIGVLSRMKKKGIDFPFDHISNHLQKYDLVFGNLEAVLSNSGLVVGRLESEETRSIPQAVDGIKKAGINICNIANNHALQHGEFAYLETIALLKQHDLTVVGEGASSGDYHCIPSIVAKKDIKIGFLGYSFEQDKYFDGPPLYAQCSVEEIVSDIQRLKQVVDLVVISCHWGLEFIDRPSLNTIHMGRSFIEAGARIVLGHHPHVVQGVEKYRNGVICYSLGNFIFDMSWNQNFRDTMIIIFTIEDEEIEFQFLPVQINAYFQPCLAVAQEKNRLQRRFIFLSEKIALECFGDPEEKALDYYLEYEKLRKKNRYDSYRYFAKNMLRMKKGMVAQNLIRTLTRRLRGE